MPMIPSAMTKCAGTAPLILRMLQLLGAKEVAQWLGFSRAWSASTRMAADGLLAVRKAQEMSKISASRLMRLLSARTVQPQRRLACQNLFICLGLSGRRSPLAGAGSSLSLLSTLYSSTNRMPNRFDCAAFGEFQRLPYYSSTAGDVSRQ
jgi:hypothetical protein